MYIRHNNESLFIIRKRVTYGEVVGNIVGSTVLQKTKDWYHFIDKRMTIIEVIHLRILCRGFCWVPSRTIIHDVRGNVTHYIHTYIHTHFLTDELVVSHKLLYRSQ